jgi:hypothetical protein
MWSSMFRRGHAWHSRQDEQLLRMVEQYGPSWTLLSFKFPRRSPRAVRNRYLQLTGAFLARNAPYDSDADSATVKRLTDGWDRTSVGDWLHIPLDTIDRGPLQQLRERVPRTRLTAERRQGQPLSPPEREAVHFAVLTDQMADEFRIPHRLDEDCRRHVIERLAFLQPAVDPRTGQPDNELDARRRQLWAAYQRLSDAEVTVWDCAQASLLSDPLPNMVHSTKD